MASLSFHSIRARDTIPEPPSSLLPFSKSNLEISFPLSFVCLDTKTMSANNNINDAWTDLASPPVAALNVSAAPDASSDCPSPVDVSDVVSDVVSEAPEASSSKPSSEPGSAIQYLIDNGISQLDAETVTAALGAVTTADFKLIDVEMAKEATQSLKLLPKRKAYTALIDFESKSNPKSSASPPPNKVNTDVPHESKTNALEAPVTPDECVAICIDHSGSMGTSFAETKSWQDDNNSRAMKCVVEQRSRMEAVKQVFYAFRDRTETLQDVVHEVGLIQFDSDVETLLPLTQTLSLFEEIVDDITKKGMTSIYSAIIEGCHMLKPHASTPTTDLRILLLTDGQNNSGTSPEAALEKCYAIGAVVDCIIVGDVPDVNLRKIVKLTGGSCFQIHSLSEGFELMESEAVVSLKARRGGGMKPPFVQKKMPQGGFSQVAAQSITRGSAASSVVQKSTAAVATTPVSVSSLFSGTHAAAAAAASHASASTSKSGPATKRIMKELADLAKGKSSCWLHHGEGIHVFPDEGNLFLMKALIEAPKGSYFEGGTFELNVKVPQNYPFRPPVITFQTPVYHCNVSDTGRVCLDMLMNGWSPSLSISKVLEAVRIMLKNPDTNNALRQWIAELTLMDRQSGGADTRYRLAATAATATHASRTVDEWKHEWKIM